MVISPIDNLLYGVSLTGNPKEVACVLHKEMFDVNTAFPGARWRKNTATAERGIPEEQRQVRGIIVQRFETPRTFSIRMPIKPLLESVLTLIETDGTDYPDKPDWCYAVYTSMVFFKREYGKALYNKEFPVVAMIYDKNRRQLYEQSGTLRFDKTGAKFCFSSLKTNMLWSAFTKLVRVGELAAIA